MIACMTSNFVSTSLGLSVYTREKIETNHTPLIVKRLLPNVKLVADGTYHYCQKSSAFDIQKQTYFMHKHNNLLKTLVYTAPDGTFVEIFGPFLADGKHNDEALHNYVLEMEESPLLKHLDQNEDELLLDRGFIRCKDILKFHTPKSIQKGSYQLSTKDANLTRVVTRCRNVVERSFGRLKQWGILDNTLDNSYVPVLGDLIRILVSILNRYFTPLFEDAEEARCDAEMFLENVDKRNELKEILNTTNLRWNLKIAKSDVIQQFPDCSRPYL